MVYLNKTEVNIEIALKEQEVKDAFKIDETNLNMLLNKADNLDYILAVSSGIICAMLDIFWVGDFDIKKGKEIADEKVDGFVKNVAKFFGCKDTENIRDAVKFLEEKFKIPSDGNTPDFGGGLQHHLRDFAHHPTLLGLIFSLLTQFTYKSYGTDVTGKFLVVDVPEKSRIFIGENISEKILKGTLIWFFHLVSDVAGSSSTAGLGGGTGIPGPILSLAKEMSALPLFHNMKNGEQLSEFISKLFNGTLFMKKDDNGKIIKESIFKFDFRAELGIAIETLQMAVPVIANECIVRGFFFVRHLAIEMKKKTINNLDDFKEIDWDNVKPVNSPIISRMLSISSGVFSTLDIGQAIASKKWIAINYIGVGRFAIALTDDMKWCLKKRDIKKIQKIYREIYDRNNDQTEKWKKNKSLDKMCLNIEQTEILYNIEYFKTLYDIKTTQSIKQKKLKQEWVDEWKESITQNYSKFLNIENVEIKWYGITELVKKIEEMNPQEYWYRLVLVESIIFEPYFVLKVEKDKNGNDIPASKYKGLKINSEKASDEYISRNFTKKYYDENYIKRLRKSYKKYLNYLKEIVKNTIKTITMVAGATVTVALGLWQFAPKVAVTLVGSKFVGLSGAALTNACLAYLGGGAIAIGGAGMAGGTAVIVGGGAILGVGTTATTKTLIDKNALINKKNALVQSAKLLTSVYEIFICDENDIDFYNCVCKKYAENIKNLEKDNLKNKEKIKQLKGNEKDDLKHEIKSIEKYIDVMKNVEKEFLKMKEI